MVDSGHGVEESMWRIEVPTAEAMEAVGARLARHSGPGLTVYLSGDLGAGKTTLVRGFLRGLGHQGPVRSPTFTLVEPYALMGRRVYHFDLYRLSDPEELEFLGIRDYLDPDSVRLIEWPQRGHGLIPEPDLIVNIAYSGDGRCLEWVSGSGSGSRVMRWIQDDNKL